MQKKAYEDLVAEVQELRAQLEEAQETLNAIRRGEVDGLVVSTPKHCLNFTPQLPIFIYFANTHCLISFY